MRVVESGEVKIVWEQLARLLKIVIKILEIIHSFSPLRIRRMDSACAMERLERLAMVRLTIFLP